MYCRLEAESVSDDDPSENGEPKSDKDASIAQCTSLLGVFAMLNASNED